jgi:hypothetical protein
LKGISEKWGVKMWNLVEVAQGMVQWWAFVIRHEPSDSRRTTFLYQVNKCKLLKEEDY